MVRFGATSRDGFFPYGSQDYYGFGTDVVRHPRSPISRGRAATLPEQRSFNRDSFANHLRDVMERNIRGMVTPVAPVAPPEDPLGNLYSRLIEALQETVTVDEADLMAQVRGQFDPVYDARRAALEGMMSAAQTRTASGRGEVEGMYEALGQDYERLAPEQAEMAEEQREATEQLYGQLRSNIEGNYSRIQGEQADLFKQLGIEAAAPEVLAPQGEKAAAAMAEGETLGTLAQQRQADIGRLEEEYYREGAPIARLTGSNLSASMLADLEEYLRSRESDIGVLEGERTAGIQSAYSQMLQQAQASARQQEQFQTSHLMDLLMGQMQSQSPDLDMSDPSTFLQMLPGGQAQNVLDAYRGIERQPEIVQGKQPFPGTPENPNPIPGEFTPVTLEYWLNEVDKMLEEGLISEDTANVLLQYVRLMQG